jgi:hypothetical protein
MAQIRKKIGDYMHMISTDEGVHLAWAATFNGEQDIYYSFITPDVMSATHNPPETSNTFIITPNPFRKATRLEYTLPRKKPLYSSIFMTLKGSRSFRFLKVPEKRVRIGKCYLASAYPAFIMANS